MEGKQSEFNLGDRGDYDLYNGAPPHQAESDTSAAAAFNILDSVNGMQKKVYDFISFCGKKGSTDAEIQECLDMTPSTQVPRRRELVLKGLVIDSGKRRKNPSGCNAVVWVKTTVPHPPPAQPTSKKEETKALSDVIRDQAKRIKELEADRDRIDWIDRNMDCTLSGEGLHVSALDDDVWQDDMSLREAIDAARKVTK